MFQKIGAKNIIYSVLVGVLLLSGGIFTARLGESVSVNKSVGDIAYEVHSSVPVGQIYLEVSGLQENQSLKLLVNGVPSVELDTLQKTVDVPNGCVVEVDSRQIEGPVTVSITGKSTGVVTDCVGRSVTVEDGIANLGTFVVKEHKAQ